MSENQQSDLEDEVRRLARLAPPEHVREAARDAFAQRERDSAVLPLVSDSLTDSEDDAPEDTDATRVLVFAGTDTRVELRIAPRHEGRQLFVTIEGPRVLTAQIRTPAEKLVLASDAQNRYVREDVPRGPVTVLVEVEGTPPGRRHTEWTVV
jgi:hypothetical protein